ncbi:MAG: DciA family protein [Alphaproteobacteria bacterium]|nr:DciA family protein [Alphaproteobacteria bacterium]
MPRPIADAVDKIARQSAGKDWGLYASLLNHWAEIVGMAYAKVTTPIKVTFPYQPTEAQRKNGVLTIKLPKGLAMEFSFKAESVRQRINSYLGYEAFSRITFDANALSAPMVRKKKKADPAALKGIRSEAARINNPELREALEKFGEAILDRFTIS